MRTVLHLHSGNKASQILRYLSPGEVVTGRGWSVPELAELARLAETGEMEPETVKNAAIDIAATALAASEAADLEHLKAWLDDQADE